MNEEKTDWKDCFDKWKNKMKESTIEWIEIDTESNLIALQSNKNRIELIYPTDKSGVFFVCSENDWQSDLNSFILSSKVTFEKVLDKVKKKKKLKLARN